MIKHPGDMFPLLLSPASPGGCPFLLADEKLLIANEFQPPIPFSFLAPRALSEIAAPPHSALFAAISQARWSR